MTKQIQGVVIVLIGVICFSTKAVFIKLAYQHHVDSTTLLFLRLAFAMPFYLIVFIQQIQRHGIPDRKTLIKVVILGLLGYYVASWLDFTGLMYITASMERLILFAYPTFVVLISSLILRKKITLSQILALILTYIGVAIIVIFRSNTASSNQDFHIGAFLIVLSALTYAGYLVGSGEIMKKLGAVRFTSIAMLASCTGVCTHQTIAGNWDIFDFAHEVYVYAFIMAILATLIPSFLISAGIKLIGASNTSIIGAAGPVSTIILAYTYLGESINPYQIGGTILVMAGVLIISLQKA